ncbi:hypothetical protein MJD09_12910, partial [bacterium]|nr:hypothetical protein [bacterium]
MIDCPAPVQTTAPGKVARPEPLRFREIAAPKVAALVVPGTGTKLLQSLLDSHEQIYMIPAYPLMYFYPHWMTWETELKDVWHWKALIDIFCEKHASVLDSRKIAGHNGLTTLGESHDQHIEIDESLFRSLLLYMLQDEPIHRRTFLLAIHYCYALCQSENLRDKKLLLYHIHVIDYA